MDIQIKKLGDYVSRVARAIDEERPRAAKRFTRDLVRWMHAQENATNYQVWNYYSGLDRYTFPGAYPLFYIDSENSALCADCAVKSLSEYICDQFRPITADVNYEDRSLYCDQCSKHIESAYAEDQDDNTERIDHE